MAEISPVNVAQAQAQAEPHRKDETQKTVTMWLPYANWLSSMALFNLNNRKVTDSALKKADSTVSHNHGGNGTVFECVVCLCEVSHEDEDGWKKLPNCNHGVQFHGGCIESWLKDHSTCPLCRSHVPQPLRHRLNTCLLKLRRHIVYYCDTALQNVATSIEG